MDLTDFPMAKGVLAKLASGGPKPDSNYVPPPPDAAKRNQDYADKRLAQQKQSGSPLSTTMTPVTKSKASK